MSQHYTADGEEIVAGGRYWDNNLRVVEVTRVAVASNDYPGGETQTWHQTTGGEADSLWPGNRWGRLAAVFGGVPASAHAPGTNYADVKP